MTRYTPCPTAAARDVLSANMLYPVMRTGRRTRRNGLRWLLGGLLSFSALAVILV